MYLLLVNPEAGNKRFGKIKTRLLKTLERLAVKFSLVELPNLVDLHEVVSAHLKPSTTGIVVVGGNATVNTVINEVADQGVPLGIIPVGKTNYLAHSLGIKNWQIACRVLADPDTQARRLGKIGKHYFVGQLEILSHQNLLGKYLRKESFVKKFLGTSTVPRRTPSVNAEIKIDNELQIRGVLHKLSIKLNDERGSKKLRLELVTDSSKNVTKLWGDEIEIEGDKKMPVLMGNETVAHTPVEIKGSSKYIDLLTLKKPVKLTKKSKK